MDAFGLEMRAEHKKKFDCCIAASHHETVNFRFVDTESRQRGCCLLYDRRMQQIVEFLLYSRLYAMPSFFVVFPFEWASRERTLLSFHFDSNFRSSMYWSEVHYFIVLVAIQFSAVRLLFGARRAMPYACARCQGAYPWVFILFALHSSLWHALISLWLNQWDSERDYLDLVVWQPWTNKSIENACMHALINVCHLINYNF